MKATHRLLVLLASLATLFAAVTYGQFPDHSAGLSTANTRIAGGPFAVGVTSRTATVAWVIQSDEVSLQASGDHGPVVTSPAFRVERTTFSGLQANTRYEYNIASLGSAGRGSFKTAPVRTEDEYRFVVYGDTRTRNDVHRAVIGELMKHGVPDFVVHTGDLVADGNTSALWPVFFGIEGDLLRQAAFFPSLGNHERNTHYFYDLFAGGAPYYSFDWGNSHFSVINSDIGNVGQSERERDNFWNEQKRWLEEDLQSHQKTDYRFVAAHHPPFTAVARRQGENLHMTALVALFEKYHVSAGFFGHDHNYQHYLKTGIHYVTTGGGGAPLYDVDKPPEGITQKVVSVENFVSVAVVNRVAHVKAIAIDGQTLDEFEIQGESQP